MVKLKGPGLATGAAGKLADSLIFSNWKGRAYLKKNTTPKDPKSQAQVSVRTVTQLIATDWRNFTPADQATWNDLAADTNVSPYNACLAFNLTQWRNFLYPSKTHPPTRTGVFHGLGSITVVPHGRGALWTYTVAVMNDGWTLAIHHVPASGGAATYANCIRMMRPPGVGTITWLWSPLTAGTYHFRAVLTTNSGAAALPGGIRSVTIT